MVRVVLPQVVVGGCHDEAYLVTAYQEIVGMLAHTSQ